MSRPTGHATLSPPTPLATDREWSQAVVSAAFAPADRPSPATELILHSLRVAQLEVLATQATASGDARTLREILDVLSSRRTASAARLHSRVEQMLASPQSMPADAEPKPAFRSRGPSPGSQHAVADILAHEGTVQFRLSDDEFDSFLGQIREPDHPSWYRLRQRAERLALNPGFDELIAIDANTIEELPHQTETAIRVLRQMGGRALLADEVGLGKTIEAGLILKELLVRRLVRRVLILCPASLVDQWQAEMDDKFHLQFNDVESPRDWSSTDLTIASHARVRHTANRSRATARPWDLVIVDEAHKAKNHQTALYQTLQEMRRDFMLLLTATPLQNDLREFYNLVTLLRPGQFGTWREFSARHIARGTRMPRDPTAIRSIASQVMIRNRRANVDLHLPRRIPHRPQFALEAEEQALYGDIRSFLRTLYREGMYPDAAIRNAHFLLTNMAQRACSSSQAIASSFLRLSENFDVRPEFRAEARALGRRANAIRSHAKLRALDTVMAMHEGERVVVFSEHRPTIDLIQRHLEARGRRVLPYHGGIDRARKARVKREFQATPNAVFLSSRSGTEGLNLQCAHVLVNYELPWNPLLVEQRIGRVHRIGQTSEVHIYNLAASGTVEDRILEVLAEKIKVFELVVGELDVILGRFEDASELEKRFTQAWLAASSEEVFEREIERLEREVDQSFAEGRRSEELSSFIAPEDTADRLEREFTALSIPTRVRMAYGTRLMNLPQGVEAKRISLGLTVPEIQNALRLADSSVESAGVGEYGPQVRIHSATGRGRGVSLLVSADRLPVTIIDLDADEEAPLAPPQVGLRAGVDPGE